MYSLRHARCATDASSACQYVLVTTNTVRGGLGNRLPSLITGLLLALLTRCPLLPGSQLTVEGQRQRADRVSFFLQGVFCLYVVCQEATFDSTNLLPP